MARTVDIDRNSGFCAGVIKAINNAESYLDSCGEDRKLFSLGAIVHNDAELNRLSKKGLITIDREDLDEMAEAKDEVLLIRAHGEPPKTYMQAEKLGFKIIDSTCPVVLQLQKSIKEADARMQALGRGKILIFGKLGHAEVLGLVGQTEGRAIVIENLQMLEGYIADGTVRLDEPVEIFSQTTKSPAEFSTLCTRLEENMAKYNEMHIERFRGMGLLKIHNTICKQVATRYQNLSDFSINHDVIVFVSGKASSNGKVLCELCKSLNIRTYHIDSVEEIKKEWFRPDDKVGVCGATSTPKWLLEEVAAHILALD